MSLRHLILVLAILLGILHQDCWFWDDQTLLLGFLPVGLAYHALYSVAAAVVWALAVRFAWPSELEAWADAFQASGADASQASGADASQATELR